MSEMETDSSSNEDLPSSIESTPTNTKPSGEEESSSLLQKSTLIAERMEAANKVRLELLEREERLAAETLLGGVSRAGQQVKPKEETPKEYMEKVMRGEFNGQKKR